jgi:hypothetical protein
MASHCRDVPYEGEQSELGSEVIHDWNYELFIATLPSVLPVGNEKFGLDV